MYGYLCPIIRRCEFSPVVSFIFSCAIYDDIYMYVAEKPNPFLFTTLAFPNPQPPFSHPSSVSGLFSHFPALQIATGRTLRALCAPVH